MFKQQELLQVRNRTWEKVYLTLKVYSGNEVLVLQPSDWKKWEGVFWTNLSNCPRWNSQCYTITSALFSLGWKYSITHPKYLQMTSCKGSGLQMSKSECTLVELVQMQLSHGNGGGKALIEEDGAVPESRNLFSRNTANCQFYCKYL